MGVQYAPVLWNKNKKKYDLILWGLIISMILFFAVFQMILRPTSTPETLIIRSTSLTAFALLHIILAIGPLARLDRRFLPLLYNRRHLGVSMFLIAFIHGAFSIIQFHSFGDKNAIINVFTSNPNYQSISEFPFQILGFFALMILFLMAATSHDFWLKNLSPPIWKALHMGVYVVYGLIIAHVATGALQYENNPVYWSLLVLGFVTISALHISAGVKEKKKLKFTAELEKEGFVQACSIEEIDEKCAKVFFIDNENIAVFKYDNKVSAVNNVCKHQMGPLGEGKIIDGCITCPWHGYQYLPENGQSPAPFKEKVTTYETKVVDGKVWINPKPKEEGTFVEPALISN